MSQDLLAAAKGAHSALISFLAKCAETPQILISVRELLAMGIQREERRLEALAKDVENAYADAKAKIDVTGECPHTDELRRHFREAIEAEVASGHHAWVQQRKQKWDAERMSSFGADSAIADLVVELVRRIPQ